MAGVPQVSVARKRTWRSLPNLIGLSVMIVVLWQVWGYYGAISLQSFIPYGAHFSSRQFNTTSQLLKVQNRLDESLHLAQLALKKLEVLENDSLERIGNLENKTSLQLEILGDNLEKKDAYIEEEINHLKGEEEMLRAKNAFFLQHMAETPDWNPLRDLETNNNDRLMSDIIGRGMLQGPPEFFEFPSNLSHGRHLCFLGNNTRNGTKNLYTYAWRESLPKGSLFLKGVSLISDTYFDFTNPWHSMYNLVQFVHWRHWHGCIDADRLLLFHWGEVRNSMGDWITKIFISTGLPQAPEQGQDGNTPICFERAVLSRSGIGGVPKEMLQVLYRQVRCSVRHYCKVPIARSGPQEDQSVQLTLVVRSGPRAWKNVSDWEEVVKSECGKVSGCQWGIMRTDDLSFCEQVAIMSKTDILVSVHGAQLTNMIWMSPGGRILEMFPKGWLELAGNGQFIYSLLAEWVGLKHDGYWRDLEHPDCPDASKPMDCLSFYKDLEVGINVTHVRGWLEQSISDFNSMQADLAKPLAERKDKQLEVRWDENKCDCPHN